MHPSSLTRYGGYSSNQAIYPVLICLRMRVEMIYPLLHVKNPAGRQRMQRIIKSAALNEVFSRGMEGYRPFPALAYPVFEIVHKNMVNVPDISG